MDFTSRCFTNTKRCCNQGQIEALANLNAIFSHFNLAFIYFFHGISFPIWGGGGVLKYKKIGVFLHLRYNTMKERKFINIIQSKYTLRMVPRLAVLCIPVFQTDWLNMTSYKNVVRTQGEMSYDHDKYHDKSEVIDR